MMCCVNRYRAKVVVTLLSLSLSACQNLVTSTPPEALPTASTLEALVDRHERLVNTREQFEVKGGLGIWTDDESIAARITWQQTPERLYLTIVGPLGIGTMQLENIDNIATLTRGKEILARGPSADRVLQQGLSLQAPVPLEALAFWIRGLPGQANRVKRDEQGKLLSLQFTDEQGRRWQARFRRYTNWEGVEVPSLITASGGPYSVRIVLKQWQNVTSSVVPNRPESNNRLPIPGR